MRKWERDFKNNHAAHSVGHGNFRKIRSSAFSYRMEVQRQ